MKYSPELIAKVKQVYPDWDAINKAAISGNAVLGRYLCDSQLDGIKNEEVLCCHSLEAAHILAKMRMETVNLYQMWCSETRN